MKTFISIGENNQVESYGSAPTSANDIEIEVPANDPFFGEYLSYKYENGVLSKSSELAEQVNNYYDELNNKKSNEQQIETLNAVSLAIIGESETVEEGRMKIVAQQVNRALQMFAQTLGEEKALEIAELYPVYEPNKAYKANEIFRSGFDAAGKSQLFTVIQAHTSLPNWIPKDLPALYKKIGFTPGGIPIWVQPLGGTDAYKVGDIVMHNGQKWRSTAAANVWQPGVYGWVIEP